MPGEDAPCGRRYGFRARQYQRHVLPFLPQRRLSGQIGSGRGFLRAYQILAYFPYV